MAKKKRTNGEIRRMQRASALREAERGKAKKPTPAKPKLTRRELEEKAAMKAKRTKLALIIFAIVALVGVVVSVAAVIIGSYMSKRKLDYLNGNLGRYVRLDEDDYAYDVKLAVDKVEDVHVNQAIIELLCASKNKTATELGKTNRTVTVGDILYIRYRGYTLDERGNKIAFDGGCNFPEAAAKELEIGSGGFITGFELGLIGKNPIDYDRFVRLYSGEVQQGDLIYVTYTALYPDGTSQLNKTTTLDLGGTAASDIFGADYRTYFLGDPTKEGSGPKKAGETLSEPFLIPNYKGEGGTATISDIKIQQIYRLGQNPLTLALTFPKSYSSEDLAGKDVFFDVYIEGADLYDAPEYDDSFISKTLGLSDEDLADYEGQTLTEKHTAKVRAELEAEYELQVENLIQQAMWEHYIAKAKVKRLPKNEVNTFYNMYLKELESGYNASGYMSYESFDEYATAYFGIESPDTTWRQVLTLEAENSVVEKLILFYLMQKEELLPTEEELAEVYDRIVDKYLESYLLQASVKRENYDTEEKYLADVAKCRAELLKQYGEDYFTESAYFEIAFKSLRQYANIIE